MKKVSKLLLLLLNICFYGYSAIDTQEQRVFSISVDLSRPMSITWPFEVAVVGDNGEKGLRIGANIGRGWRGEAGGDASYRFYVPESGRYYIWAYCLWYDECANAIFASFDEMEKAIVGNDPVYNRWHWVRGFGVDLEKGTHRLVLSNHSDHIAVQKLLLINSSTSSPEESGEVFCDIFYDGFDGCDRGNFAEWQVISGRWKVLVMPDQAHPEENALNSTSEKEALIIHRGDDWSNYCLNVSVKSEPAPSVATSVGICFGVKDADSYFELKCFPESKTGTAYLKICRKVPGSIKVLAESEIAWDGDAWHQVQIELTDTEVTVQVDDVEPFGVAVDGVISGGIGLHLEGRISAYFDDIHVRQITKGDF